MVTKTPEPVPSPSVSNLRIPVGPGYPGSQATFWTGQKEFGDFSEPASPELIFTYERLHIIRVEKESKIDPTILRSAIRFPHAKQRSSYALTNYDSRSTLSLPVGPRYTANTLPGQKQPPYIIYGDVHIESGPLDNYDFGYLQAGTENAQIRHLRIGFDVLSQRGPPTAEFMLALGKKRLERTVYVVGHIRSLHGPDQFRRSFMYTSVIDLTPSKRQRDDFERKNRQFHEEIARITSTYGVTESAVLSSQGKEVEISGGKVYDVAARQAARENEVFRAQQQKAREDLEWHMEQAKRAERTEF